MKGKSYNYNDILKKYRLGYMDWYEGNVLSVTPLYEWYIFYDEHSGEKLCLTWSKCKAHFLNFENIFWCEVIKSHTLFLRKYT